MYLIRVVTFSIPDRPGKIREPDWQALCSGITYKLMTTNH